MEQVTFGKIKNFSFAEIPFLCHTTLHYHVQNTLHFSPIMSHMKPTHTSISYYFEYISLLSPNLRFQQQFCYKVLISHKHCCVSRLFSSSLCSRLYVVMRTNYEYPQQILYLATQFYTTQIQFGYLTNIVRIHICRYLLGYDISYIT